MWFSFSVSRFPNEFTAHYRRLLLFESCQSSSLNIFHLDKENFLQELVCNQNFSIWDLGCQIGGEIGILWSFREWLAYLIIQRWFIKDLLHPGHYFEFYRTTVEYPWIASSWHYILRGAYSQKHWSHPLLLSVTPHMKYVRQFCHLYFKISRIWPSLTISTVNCPGPSYHHLWSGLLP